jgi:hypothetical protein
MSGIFQAIAITFCKPVGILHCHKYVAKSNTVPLLKAQSNVPGGN